MAKTETATLELSARPEQGSRAMRRLRRAGSVPGIIYGGAGEAVPFAVDALTLRNTLARAGAVLEVTIGSGQTENVVVKDLQRHPVRGEIMHADLLRVRMDVAIQTPVSVELLGAESAPGVTEGGVLSQEHREVTVEALPGDIPDVIQVDVSQLAINETLTLASITPPQGVTFVDDPETVLATITPPTLEPVEDEIETETELVGEDGEVAEAKAEGDTADEAEQSAEDSGSDSE
jgi:large subunit ribosomal protein L25